MLISVVVPAYNVADYLGETLESVLAQTWRPLEVVVVDDGSTDRTAEVAARFADRIRLVRQANAGAGAARNHGFRVSRGELVTFLDGDDLWEPDALERQVALLRRHPDSGAVVCDGVQFGAGGLVADRLIFGPLGARLREAPDGVVSGDLLHELIDAGLTTPGQVLMPRAVFAALGPFVERREYAEDWDLWLLIARRHRVTMHAAKLLRYRERAESMSGPGPWREVLWTFRRIPVIRARRRDFAAPAAARLDARLARIVRYASRLAYARGRAIDRRKGLRYLWKLALAAPMHPAPLANLLALALPEPLVAWTLALARRTTGRGRP